MPRPVASSLRCASSTTAPAPSPNSTQVRAILPVEDAAEGLRADHQRAVVRAGADHRIGDLERIEEARADRRDVERDAIVDAEQRLHVVALEGKVWSGVAVASTIRPISCGDLPAAASAARAAAVASVAVVSPGAGDMAEADAGTLDDPFVAGVDGLGEFGVRDAARGQGRSGADDDRTQTHAVRHAGLSLRNCRDPR